MKPSPRPSDVEMSARISRFWRGRGDAARRVYMTVRRSVHVTSHLTRTRLARAARPASSIAVPEAEGFRCFPPGTFVEADEAAGAYPQLLERSSAAVEERRRARGSKQFLINLLEPDEVTLHDPLLRLALRPDVLDAVISYMGTVPILRSIQVFYSGAVERELVSSQLYHCDSDDVRQLKIFVLCSAVQRPNGPLTVLDAARSSAVRRATRYAYHTRLQDHEVHRIIGAHQPFELVGDPGTACFVDTSRCLHFGSRVATGAAPRLVAMAQYLSPFAFVLPGDARRGARLSHLVAPGQSALQRAVLTGEHKGL